MENNETKGATQTSGGSGSAEQTDRTRDEQKNHNLNLDNDQKEKIAGDIDVPANKIAGFDELTANNGRDDESGGSGDGMTDVSTNEPTEHF